MHGENTILTQFHQELHLMGSHQQPSQWWLSEKQSNMVQNKNEAPSP